MKIVGQEQPWSFRGPDGLVSVLGIVFEGDLATLDNAALHARSHVEAGIRFSEEDAARGRGERVVCVWVVYPGQGPPESYHGACSVELWIDRASGTGFKKPIDHVNRMSEAVRGRIDVAELNPTQRESLAALLSAFSQRAWERSSEELRKALLGA